MKNLNYILGLHLSGSGRGGGNAGARGGGRRGAAPGGAQFVGLELYRKLKEYLREYQQKLLQVIKV